MANTKSAKKDLRRSEKRRVQNQSVRTALKTYVKKARVSIAAGDPATMVESLRAAEKALDKAVQNGVIHKNQAARRKSRIAKAIAAAQAK
jgi:small subunit ribosomal protein S20